MRSRPRGIDQEFRNALTSSPLTRAAFCLLLPSSRNFSYSSGSWTGPSHDFRITAHSARWTGLLPTHFTLKLRRLSARFEDHAAETSLISAATKRFSLRILSHI